MIYPENCIRGIPNSDFLINDGAIGSHLFYFKTEHKRDDGLIEQSINWEDDDTVIEFTLNQKKENGERQFKAGVAIIPREEIDRLSKRPTIRDLVTYERQPLQNNPYHGNILLQANVPKPTMKNIAAYLALSVSRVVLQ
jgi:hypothetical protein